jgi:hypothetical protein
MVSPALNRCRDGSITYLTLNGFAKLFLNCGSDMEHNHRIAVTKSNDNRILLAKLNLIGALLNISLRLVENFPWIYRGRIQNRVTFTQGYPYVGNSERMR